MTKFIALIGGAVLVLAVGCTGNGEDTQPPVASPTGTETVVPSPELEKHTLQGAVHLGAASVAFSVMAEDIEGRDCQGMGSAADIGKGTQVTVKDDAGTVIGLARLGLGQLRVLGEEKEIADCVFRFDVPDLPASRFYTIAAANRPAETYSSEELQSEGWSMDLILEVEPLDIDILD